jgi:hypothetical protein
MRNSFGFFGGLPGCRSAVMANCSSHAFSIWRMATRTLEPADAFCAPGFPGAMPAWVEHQANWRRLGWLRRKASVTPAGDCAATEWTLPRIVIQTSETVRVEGVSRTGQSRPHKQNTQEGGSRADARTQLRKSAEVSALGLSHAERISLERRLGQIQAELAEACRKREAARGAALFAEQCRHHSALGWTEPRPPNWLDDPGEILRPEPTGWLCVENRALPITEIDLLEIIPGRGLHIRTRQESWLISLPEDLQSDELLRAITSGEVNCLSGSCEPFMP